MFKDKEAFNQYMRQWKKENREKDIKKAREIDRKHRRRWVKRNPEAAKEYMKNYFKEWLKNPINNKSHGIRTRISSLRSQLRDFPDCELRESNQILYENLLKIGWRLDMPKEKVVNHICSLKILLEFKFDLPMYILSSYLNMEICDKSTNSRAVKRKINKKILKTAERLEREFPSELEGFSSHLKTLEGQVV